MKSRKSNHQKFLVFLETLLIRQGLQTLKFRMNQREGQKGRGGEGREERGRERKEGRKRQGPKEKKIPPGWAIKTSSHPQLWFLSTFLNYRHLDAAQVTGRSRTFSEVISCSSSFPALAELTSPPRVSEQTSWSLLTNPPRLLWVFMRLTSD